MHKRLTQHLESVTKTVNGKVYTMNPKRGQSGRVVRSVFTPSERIKALDDFYKSYNGGEYYQDFVRELQYTLANGLFR